MFSAPPKNTILDTINPKNEPFFRMKRRCIIDVFIWKYASRFFVRKWLHGETGIITPDQSPQEEKKNVSTYIDTRTFHQRDANILSSDKQQWTAAADKLRRASPILSDFGSKTREAPLSLYIQ